MQMVTTGEEKLGERYKSRIDIKNNCLYKSEQQDNQQEIILLFTNIFGPLWHSCVWLLLSLYSITNALQTQRCMFDHF